MSEEMEALSTGDEDVKVATPSSRKRKKPTVKQPAAEGEDGHDGVDGDTAVAARAAPAPEPEARDRGGRRTGGAGRRKARYDRPPNDGFVYESRSVLPRSNRTAACTFPCALEGCEALRSVIWTAQGRIRECEVSPAHNHPPVGPPEEQARPPGGTGGGGGD
jgi:hypothetical protein